MNILDTIIAHKKKEVAARKEVCSLKTLERSTHFGRQAFSLTEFIRRPGRSGIIAEIKRKSPSKGVIHANASIEKISTGYAQAGASAISVLTDSEFFGGSNEDLLLARQFNVIPILRKDFTIDEYQIVEAKSIGADAILLIAAALRVNEVRSLAAFAHTLGLQVLLEVHNEEELAANLHAGADLIGVNNRNLKTFELSVEISRRLAEHIPHDVVKVSESGIENVNTILDLKKYGYEGFLMGQNFMQDPNPEEKCREFIYELNGAMKADSLKQ